MDLTQPESQRLRRDVEWALRRALDPSDVLPLLHRLARTAPAGTDESVFAHRQLAELLVERHPWRATLHAKKVLAQRPDDDRAWAVLAASQTMLGNYRFAASGYHRALQSAPKNPWYAHNLGHLLDVALGRAEDALVWLKSAYAGANWSAEIAASFSHALARAGKLAEAKRVLARAMKRGASREQTALWRWLEKGAPPEKDSPPPRPPMPGLWSNEPDGHPLRRARAGAASAEGLRGSRKNKPAVSELEAALGRGLARLPLDTKQRARARALTRDAAFYCASNDASAVSAPASNDTAAASAEKASDDADASRDVQALAAAIAYAIVYVDHVPLTQGEVAACFRVSASALRGRFKELRSQLDLTPGDARYATR